MANLYIDEQLTPDPGTRTVTVQGDEARHAIKVARLREGEQIRVSNGQGFTVEGTVTSLTNSDFEVSVHNIQREEPPRVRLWLVQALAKGDRAERAVELATEFGVWGIIPWKADRSIVKWSTDKASKGVEKWRRIAREAAKQSMRSYVPRVQDPVTTQELLKLTSDKSAGTVVLHPRDASPLTLIAKQILSPATTEVFICVGPEGGVSDEELQAFAASGIDTALLGPEVLRTSSAGAGALAVFNTMLGRW